MNLLVVMPLLSSNPDESYILPLGIMYVSAAIKKAGFKVFTLNLNHLENPYRVLETVVQNNNIDIVLTGGMSPQYSEVLQIFKIAKLARENIISICGGGLISSDPVVAMTALEIVDYGIIGEGEVTAAELCQALENGGDVSNVNGIVYKVNETYNLTAKRREIKDIDSIPWPDYDGFDFDKYITVSIAGINGINFKRAAMIITSRSCPFACTFCFHTSGRVYRQRSMDNVFEEIEYLVTKYQVGFFFVTDELFSQSAERVREFCERIKPYNIPWTASLRVDGITDDILKMMKDANCASIGIGIESADNSILKSMNKRITVEEIEVALEKAYKISLPIFGNFIFGDVNETAETANKTIAWWRKNQKYGIFLKMIKVYPGTAIYKHALIENKINDPVAFLKDGCPPVNISRMSEIEMKDLVTQVTLLPIEENANVHNINVLRYNKVNSTCDISGECQYCGSENIWDTVSLFTLNFVTCSHCNEKLAIPTPKEIIKNIDNNLKKEISKGKRIALWGVADYAISFLNGSSVVKASDNIFLIDLSIDKQGIRVANKGVNSPDIITKESIEIVIVLVPVFYSTIKSQITSQFGECVSTVSIYDYCL